jgi:hypothetical protein
VEEEEGLEDMNRRKKENFGSSFDLNRKVRKVGNQIGVKQANRWKIVVTNGWKRSPN